MIYHGDGAIVATSKDVRGDIAFRGRAVFPSDCRLFIQAHSRKAVMASSELGGLMVRKILVVDDSLIARKMIISCLPKDDHIEIFEATDGMDGVSKYGEVRPDLTMMDLTMPVMDGYEATASILAEDPDALIVVLTADIQPKSIERVKTLGAFDVIAKPPKPEKIQEMVARVNELARTKGSI